MLYQEEDQEFGLQIAPILDLLFVLLMFFMVSVGSRSNEKELGLNLSAGQPSAPPLHEAPAITLRIDQLGQVYWNGIPVDSAESPALAELIARLVDKIHQDPAQSVIVVPDPTTRQERLIDVLNAASQAKVHNLTLGAAAM